MMVILSCDLHMEFVNSTFETLLQVILLDLWKPTRYQVIYENMKPQIFCKSKRLSFTGVAHYTVFCYCLKKT